MDRILTVNLLHLDYLGSIPPEAYQFGLSF